MLPVLTAAEMRRVDERAVRELGIPGATLMENAGSGAATAILAALPRLGVRRAGARVVIICGKGGNGGDGFVVARRLARGGLQPVVLLLAEPAELRGDAALKYREMRRAGVGARVVRDASALERALRASALVVDAMLGTGARGVPTGLVTEAIERVNASGRPVVALDLPSGLPADGGAPEGPAIRASLTTTFAAPKRGLVMGAGVELAGRVAIVPIGVPAATIEQGITTFLLERSDVARHVPRRRRDTHKGSYGHLLVVAGSVGKTGAAALAARGALRAGVGLVTVATGASAQPTVAALSAEAMTLPLAETAARTVAAAARPALLAAAGERDAVAIGPGLGLDEETQALVRELAREVLVPMALDADALTALAGHLDALREARAPRCLTPHPGEMGRLLGVPAAEIQRDRIAAARDAARRGNAHVVLKGATSVIAAPDGRVVLNPTGNPGMASGGTGDVLTGVLGAFLARGLAPGVALECAVYLHGSAGDVAAERVGEESLVAGDVVEALPEAFRRLRDGAD